MPEIVSREEAKARGLRRYFTGRPCKHGHIAERYVASPNCVTCKDAHHREWKRLNPEKVKKARKRIHDHNRDRDNAQNREWYRKNKAGHRTKNKAWAQAHREKMREYTRKSYLKNIEKEKERRRRAYWSDPDKSRERVHRYRYEGPLNPKGDSQWLSKAKASLRSLNRLLKPRAPAPSSSPKKAQKA